MQVEALDASGFDGKAGGAGCVRLLATVEESARLLAADGTPGDSYQTEYQVGLGGSYQTEYQVGP